MQQFCYLPRDQNKKPSAVTPATQPEDCSFLLESSHVSNLMNVNFTPKHRPSFCIILKASFVSSINSWRYSCPLPDSTSYKSSAVVPAGPGRRIRINSFNAGKRTCRVYLRKQWTQSMIKIAWSSLTLSATLWMSFVMENETPPQESVWSAVLW